MRRWPRPADCSVPLLSLAAMPPAPAPPSPHLFEHVTGVIERVTFHSPDTGFGVLQVQVRGKRDLVTIVGTLPEVRAGEWVEAEGRWAMDPTHGQQFRAQVLKTAQPDTVEGMQKYLASGLIKGIGPTFAERLVSKAIQWVQKKVGLELAEAQRRAIELAVKSKVMVITGGPGVGKTTLVNSILQILRAKGLRVVLCAPTGRAAKRLGEATGLEATTIHRLLEFDPRIGDFKHHHEYPLEGDVFVVDETSMVDLVLAHKTVGSIDDRRPGWLITSNNWIVAA